MVKFVNVLEEVLVRETYIQIDDLRFEIKSKVKVAEVVAYALNRLPPLFATSIKGWNYQYAYATNELHPQILQLVRQGIKTVLYGDPLHDLTPLPNHLFTNSAGVLYQLRKILEREHLRWRDIPILVEETVSQSANETKVNSQTVIQEDTLIQDSSHLNRHTKALLSSSKRFKENLIAQQKQQALKQQALRLYESSFQGQLYGESAWARENKAMAAVETEYRALQSYTLRAQLGLVNVIEHLVFRVMEKIMKPELYAEINRDEVAAYALNRLPPMYATSDRGFKYLRQKIVTELAREVVGAVRNGVMKVRQFPYTDVSPIYAYHFEREYEQSMKVLNVFFNRDDISLQNIVPIVRDLLVCQSA